MATRAALPTRLKHPAETMQPATHQKTSGATAVWIRRRKMSPRILSCVAKTGNRKPTAAPSTMATIIWKPRFVHSDFLAFGGGADEPVEAETLMRSPPATRMKGALLDHVKK